ncbi:glycosyltransferase family 1 protein [Sphingosinicella sp. LHD-64]|uniref:glycosyltransferase family 4 protein n=1 Tax=Sphingosinicella sp. LHD-64 TaxID=3072139 RepID=UPI00280C8228|nr:glycosyltransferase family 1 protein [Sphingosinicella sp. LHD-64]MDQ8758216.1 glycosyltransferase family 1 protein [Sphingosinicella sp. LHD-64]
MNRILIVTDAWSPQINGVVRTLQTVRAELEKEGCAVEVISPDLFHSVPCPTYSEIRLALATRRTVGARIEAFAPDALHIATEGPLGVAARGWALKRGYRFTTAYHTQFPDYVAQRTRLPASLFWRYIRWFHRPSQAIMVSTQTMAAQLAAQGLPQTAHWGRGVDLTLFRPDAAPHPAYEGLARPIQLYVGRVAIEKNIEAFLESGHPGSKVVVGDGPALESLKRRFREAHFLGALRGPPLASAYVSADVFVFPSRTDTFGLVMIEALACGTPVAAYPVPGPLDVLTEAVGSMDEDLARATAAALTRNPADCAAYAQGFTWTASARQFRAALTPMRPVSENCRALAQPVARAQEKAQSELAEQQG